MRALLIRSPICNLSVGTIARAYQIRINKSTKFDKMFNLTQIRKKRAANEHRDDVTPGCGHERTSPSPALGLGDDALNPWAGDGRTLNCHWSTVDHGGHRPYIKSSNSWRLEQVAPATTRRSSNLTSSPVVALPSWAFRESPGSAAVPYRHKSYPSVFEAQGGAVFHSSAPTGGGSQALGGTPGRRCPGHF